MISLSNYISFEYFEINQNPFYNHEQNSVDSLFHKGNAELYLFTYVLVADMSPMAMRAPEAFSLDSG